MATRAKQYPGAQRATNNRRQARALRAVVTENFFQLIRESNKWNHQVTPSLLQATLLNSPSYPGFP